MITKIVQHFEALIFQEMFESKEKQGFRSFNVFFENIPEMIAIIFEETIIFCIESLFALV